MSTEGAKRRPRGASRGGPFFGLLFGLLQSAPKWPGYPMEEPWYPKAPAPAAPIRYRCILESTAALRAALILVGGAGVPSIPPPHIRCQSDDHDSFTHTHGDALFHYVI